MVLGIFDKSWYFPANLQELQSGEMKKSPASRLDEVEAFCASSQVML